MDRGTVSIDACLAITFGNAKAFDIVAGLQRHTVTIARRAVSEVQRPPASEELERAIEQGDITVDSIDPEEEEEQSALVRFDGMPAFRDRGDAEVLALAASRGWIVGSDDDAVRRVASAAFGIGRVAGSLDFLKWAVQERRISASSAVSLLPALDVGPTILRRLHAQGRSLEDELVN